MTQKKGGYVEHQGRFGGVFGDVLIGLAPYYLPSLAIFAALLRPLVPPDWLLFYNAGIGFLLGYHTFYTMDELSRNWTRQSVRVGRSRSLTKTDIGQAGYFLSFLMISVLTMLLHGIIFTFITRGFGGVRDGIVFVLQKGVHIYGPLTVLIYDAVACRFSDIYTKYCPDFLNSAH